MALDGARKLMFFYQDVQKSGSTAAPTKKLFLTNGETEV